MSDRFRNKYRIESTRLRNWDYGWNASYFITICTKDREWFFGNIRKDEMILNEIGIIANAFWLEIPEYFPFVKLGDHVIMPNHLHGIVVIDKPDDEFHVQTRLIASVPPPPPPSKSQPKPPPPIPPPGGITGNKNPMLNDNLSKIIRWYKGRTTFASRKIHANFAWLSRFHDHVIRDEKSFQRISKYIANNPANWAEDQFRI